MSEYDDNRPYIGGYDDIEHYNTCRGWFKHDGLLNKWMQSKGYATDYFASSKKKVSKKQEKEIDIAAEVIGVIEDTIREDLYEYAKQMEKYRSENDNYINGLQDAIRLLGGAPKKIEGESEEVEGW